jgi:hypothetical protein
VGANRSLLKQAKIGMPQHFADIFWTDLNENARNQEEGTNEEPKE